MAPPKQSPRKGITICVEKGCNRKIVARVRCHMHYQRLARQGGLKAAMPRWTPESTWAAIYGKGWLLASEVAVLIGCSERNARRMLVALTLAKRVQVISSGEDGRADLWSAMLEPRLQLELALDDMQEKISAMMLKKTVSRIIFVILLEHIEQARQATVRLFDDSAPDPKTVRLEIALEKIQIKISETMLRKSIPKAIFVTLLENVEAAKSASETVFTPTEVKEETEEHEEE